MKIFNGLTARLFGLLLLTALLSACSENTADLEAYIQSVNARPADPIPPIPPVKTYLPYPYDGLTGRDPFRQSISDSNESDQVATNPTGPRPDFERSKQYLERYELDTLSMVGTFNKEQYRWVLIRDPVGVIHRLAVENYMGKNHGQVIRISGTSVSVSELIPDGSGGWLVREASIALGD